MGVGKSRSVSTVAKPRGDKDLQLENLTDKDFGISEDSYIYDAEYKKLEEEHSALHKEFLEVNNRIEELSSDKYKPREEWDDLEVFMYETFGDKPVKKEYIDAIRLKDDILNKLNSKNDEMKSYSKSHTATLTSEKLPKQVTATDSKYITSKTTGTSFYDTFLTEEGRAYMNSSRGLNSYVTMMTPKEYIQWSAKIFDSTYEIQVGSVNRSNVVKYANDMKNSGNKYFLPYLNLSDMGQEGRHRAFASMLLKEEQIPVLIVY